MELSMPVENIHSENVFFTEKKKNIIVDGDFVKILYSTGAFEMNGLYISAVFDTPQFCSSFTPLCFAQSNVAVSLKNMPIIGRLNEKRPTRTSELESQNNALNQNQNWIQSSNKSMQLYPKRTFTFNPLSKLNIDLIHRLCKTEHDIIDRYIEMNCPGKVPLYVLRPQLLSGIIKYHSECKPLDCTRDKLQSFDNINTKAILKISGIWETAHSVGITMKFIMQNTTNSNNK